MYQKPVLQKFGSFRELTLLGLNNPTDGTVVLSAPPEGCADAHWSWEMGGDSGPRSS